MTGNEHARRKQHHRWTQIEDSNNMLKNVRSGCCALSKCLERLNANLEEIQRADYGSAKTAKLQLQRSIEVPTWIPSLSAPRPEER